MNKSKTKNNEPEYSDLYIHTTISDSTFTPEDVVERAKSLRLKAIKITDYNTFKKHLITKTLICHGATI